MLFLDRYLNASLVLPGELFYMAQSPDEGALVTAARNFGFVFRSRTPDSVSIVEMGRQRSYELLNILDFNNVRKRMSVIGTPSTDDEFAGEGLRTLALAYKDLDEEYFDGWKRRHHEVSTSLDGREEKLDELYEEIEKDLLLKLKLLSPVLRLWLQAPPLQSTSPLALFSSSSASSPFLSSQDLLEPWPQQEYCSFESHTK
ncbi:Phospholipid-transporting ATPase ID [Liparis tanakae]|uniref:Phospholipid-transporting ATPase ID n=1 Tax=Liparis tanakae TaxID=230148 RepID=A0A4Z2FFZ1_9TELE|nr:Phospholipid-transporting ATPase ID [Liparis tanakae]